MNNLSRNAPIALVAGVAGPLGVILAKKLLEKNIQVIGVDNFSSSSPEFLEIFVKSRAFHLIEKGIQNLSKDDLPEVDYGYFLISEDISHEEYVNAFSNFLKLVSKKTKIVLLSSLDLYNQNISTHQNLKWAEGFLAEQTKKEKLNARIIRATHIYGPGMDLSVDEPLFKLVNFILAGDLSTHPISLDVLTRAVYVDDAVNLLLKAILHGSTSSKIYDCSLLNPIKLNEIRQALLDPVWYEKSGFAPTKTQAWPSPNLVKTQNELNWQPTTPILEGLRQTVGFFNKYPEFKTKVQKDLKETKTLPAVQPVKLQKLNLPEPVMPEIKQLKPIKTNDFWEDQPKVQPKSKAKPKENKPRNWSKLGSFLTLIFCLAVIGYGLIYPLTNILLAVFSLKEDLNQASQLALVGNLDQANQFVDSGSKKLAWLTQVYDDLSLLRPDGFLTDKFLILDDLKLTLSRSVAGTDNFLTGINSLNQALNIIKGESNGDLNQDLNLSETNLADAQENFELVYALINDPKFMANQPAFLRFKLNQLKDQSFQYASQSGQLLQISLLTKEVLPSDSNKNYLVVLEDNRILNPSGGPIISTLEIKVQNGKIVNLVASQTSDIDNKLGTGLPAPADVKSELQPGGLLLSNVTDIPDFVESSKWLNLIYEKGTGEKIDGVVVLDLTGVQEILDQSGSLKLGSGTEVTSANLDQLISGSDDTIKQDILKELVNKIIFVDNPNWNNLIGSLTKAALEKHLAVYVSDPAVLSLADNFNFLPSFNFNQTNQAGDKEEYLYFYENDGLNISSSNLTKSVSLNSVIDNTGSVTHNLNLNYKYSSGQKDSAKFELTIDLPRGSKVVSAKWGTQDVLKQGTTITDQNITSYSFNLEIGDSESKQLSFEYQDLLPAKFDSSNNLKYNQTIYKQIGALATPFNFSLSYPASYNIVGKSDLIVGQNMVSSQNPLDQDQNYQLIFSNN